MKNRLLLFLTISILSTQLLISQEDQFIFNNEGLLPSYVVVEIDSMNQEALFKKAINWIKETYKNPDEVIKTTIDNDKVRFEGTKANGLCTMVLGMPSCSDVRYQIEVAFKDNKYKFTIINMEQFISASQYTTAGWYPVLLGNEESKAYYRKNGKIRSMYKRYPEEITLTFNALNLSLKNYMLNEQSEKEKDDW